MNVLALRAPSGGRRLASLLARGGERPLEHFALQLDAEGLQLGRVADVDGLDGLANGSAMGAPFPRSDNQTS